MSVNKVKVIANYLPQYHTIPENDKWWGKGFTDWIAVKATEPAYEGHNQPRVPLNENYYSLDCADSIRWQASLAREYGIYGFGIYHYWFSSNQQLLQKPANMGLLSFGTGWDYGRRNQWETDVFFGVLPKYDSKRTKLTFTVKQNYLPWSLQIKQSRFSVEPLACGMYLNTVFGDEFWVNEPERYPKGYYGFSSKVRIHVFLGQRITYDIDPQRPNQQGHRSFG